MTQFFGEWDCVEDVIRDFSITADVIASYTLHVASYNVDGYEGSAFVLLEHNETRTYVEVHGSHCSCNGLEECWDMEPVDENALRHRCLTGSFCSAEARQAVLNVLNRSSHDRFALMH